MLEFFLSWAHVAGWPHVWGHPATVLISQSITYRENPLCTHIFYSESPHVLSHTHTKPTHIYLPLYLTQHL